MAVFTILNHGTNSHRDRTDGEIVADFGRNMAGTEYENFLITDGPGSSGTTKNPMPGDFDPFTKSKSSKSNAPLYSKTPDKTLLDISGHQQTFFSPTGHGVVRKLGRKAHGGVTGTGWDDNIRHAMATLAEAMPSLTGTINMIGWSRGAVTCLRMANWIQEFFGEGFTINIFAIDPVAGLDAGRKLADTIRIPGIVANYVGILAIDEMRGDFKPQDMHRVVPMDPTRTNVAFLPFPGVHNTPVLIKKAELAEVTRVVRYLGYRFLSHHGTQFRTPETTYSTQQLCDMYAQMLLKRSGYEKLQGKGFVAKQMGGLEKRTLKYNLQSYVSSNARFFINEHHRACFERSFGDIYNYFFTRTVPNPLGKVTTSHLAASQYGRALQGLYQQSAPTFDALSNVFPIERAGGMGTPAYWKTVAPGAGAVSTPPPTPGINQIITTLLS